MAVGDGWMEWAGTRRRRRKCGGAGNFEASGFGAWKRIWGNMGSVTEGWAAMGGLDENPRGSNSEGER